MSVEFYRGSPGKFDSRTLNRKTLSRWTGRNGVNANVMLFDRGAFWVLPLEMLRFEIMKTDRSVDPICPQPKGTHIYIYIYVYIHIYVHNMYYSN